MDPDNVEGSSNPSLYFKVTAHAQTAPATRPRRMAPIGVTLAHAGVIATRPATMPNAAPSDVAFLSRIFSTISHARPAAQVANKVFVAAIAAVLSAAYAEPALKPNHRTTTDRRRA